MQIEDDRGRYVSAPLYYPLTEYAGSRDLKKGEVRSVYMASVEGRKFRVKVKDNRAPGDQEYSASLYIDGR